MIDDEEVIVDEEDDIDTDAWMNTYADAITLLLCFFVLLYAQSSPDSEKLSKLASALQSELSGKPYMVEELLEGNVHMGQGETSEYDALVEKLGGLIDKNGLEEVVDMRLEEEGVVLQLGDSSLFDSGKADLKEGSKVMLNKVGTMLKDVGKTVVVEGHTDDIPMNNADFGSNWELSLHRALNVLNYLIDVAELDPSSYSAKGCGEYKPLVENNSAKNRAINRRVDIFIAQPKDTKTIESGEKAKTTEPTK